MPPSDTSVFVAVITAVITTRSMRPAVCIRAGQRSDIPDATTVFDTSMRNHSHRHTTAAHHTAPRLPPPHRTAARRRQRGIPVRQSAERLVADAPTARRSFTTLLAAASPPIDYDYSYVKLLRSFLPQSTRNRGRSQDLSQFFTSLSHYVPLFLSYTVELRRSPNLASSAYADSVFALRRIEDGKYTRSVSAVMGEQVMINESENKALAAADAAFSVLELDSEGLERVKKPGEQGRKRQRVGTDAKAFVVAGGMAFINHACEQHANVIPAVWYNSDCIKRREGKRSGRS